MIQADLHGLESALLKLVASAHAAACGGDDAKGARAQLLQRNRVKLVRHGQARRKMERRQRTCSSLSALARQSSAVDMTWASSSSETYLQERLGRQLGRSGKRGGGSEGERRTRPGGGRSSWPTSTARHSGPARSRPRARAPRSPPRRLREPPAGSSPPHPPPPPACARPAPAPPWRAARARGTLHRALAAPGPARGCRAL